MAVDKWKEYRFNVYGFLWDYVPGPAMLRILKEYILDNISIDNLNEIIEYKEKYTEEWDAQLEFIELEKLTTEQFVAFMLAMHCLRVSRYNCGTQAGKKPYTVVLLQNSKTMDKITRILTEGWREIGKLARSEELQDIHNDFSPSGTGRMNNLEYLHYVAYSHYMAIATGETMSLELAIS